MADNGGLVPLEIVGVRVELPSNQPIVLLREHLGRDTNTDGRLGIVG